jgi:hypothetical protein
MKTSKRQLVLSVALALAASSLSFAQDGSARPSPPAKAQVELKGKTVTIDYARPSMRGRKIMGALVPYDQVWRTGANEATALKTPVDLEIGGVKVPVGNYTLYSLPSEGGWKLIINKQTGQWGTEYDQAQDFARVNLAKTSVGRPLEQFTIEFVKKGPDSAELILEWETTKLSVPVRATR